MSLSLFSMSVFILLKPTETGGGATLTPVLSGPGTVYLGSHVQFHCAVPGWTSPLTFDLLEESGGVVMSEQDTEATFTMKVTQGSEGKYSCRLRSSGSSSNIVHLSVVIPVAGARVTSQPNPPIVFEGRPLALHCLVRKGTRLSYTWYHNQQQVATTSDLYQLSRHTLMVRRASQQHAGKYSCTAHNVVPVNPRYSSSPELDVIIKLNISAPTASFSVSLNGSALTANLSCGVSRGSAPVTFRLLLPGSEAQVRRPAEGLRAWFLLPLSVGVTAGSARCRAETHLQQLESPPLELLVVPVGGVVRVEKSYLFDRRVDQVVVLRLRCLLQRGTFPVFSWSLNHSLLPPGGDTHATTQGGETLFTTDLRGATYSCRARDAFNLSAEWLESEDVFIHSSGVVIWRLQLVWLVLCVTVCARVSVL